MSRQASHSNKAKQLSSALVLTMTASSSAYAVNFGQTSIQSTQYEPLSATIQVNGITSQDFDVSLANNAIYGQMGLTPNNSINARFERTSAESGRVVLTSSQPINEPFADIVLNIDNSEKKQFMPKTLLMPISASKNKAKTTQPNIIKATGTNRKPNLPVTQNLSSGIPNAKVENAQEGINSGVQAENVSNQQANSNNSAKRQAQKQRPSVTAQATAEPPIGQLPSDRFIMEGKQRVDSDANNQNIQASSKEKAKARAKNSGQANAQSANSNSTYVVQRNDNLWTIALEISKSNKLNPHTVMKQIHANNPNAFIGGDRSRIITNSTLALPNYKVVPTQSSLEKAIQARRGKPSVSRRTGKSKNTTVAVKSRNKTSSNLKASNPKRTKSNKVQSKPRVSLVAPSKNLSTKSSSSSPKGSLVNKLKNTRKQTAAKATRVNNLTTKVGSYTQKLQMQNKKLAELEARLKKLQGR